LSWVLTCPRCPPLSKLFLVRLKLHEHGITRAKTDYLRVALTCNACEKFQNAISGSINLGTSLTIALKKKVAGNFENLFSISLFVSHPFQTASLLQFVILTSAQDASLPPLASFCEPVGPQDACNASNATLAA
jgi:hypothetical protein